MQDSGVELRTSVLTPAEQELQQVARREKYNPRQLSEREIPIISPPERQGPTLEETYRIDPDTQRALFFGNPHGLIFPMLERAREAGVIRFPLSTILNVDYHADISPYTPQYDSHTASWQRYGVDHGLWKASESYNWMPEGGTSYIQSEFSPERYIRSVKTKDVEAMRGNLDVLSIDLDFFNGLSLESPEYQKYISVLEQLVKRAKVVMAFASPAWTYGSLGKEVLELPVMQDAVKRITNAFSQRE